MRGNDKRTAACNVLGLDPDADHHPEHVYAAFRAKVKDNHPDNGGDGSMDMDALVKARKLLLEPLTKPGNTPTAGSSTTCEICKGIGSIPTRSFQTMACPACNGSGVRPW